MPQIYHKHVSQAKAMLDLRYDTCANVCEAPRPGYVPLVCRTLCQCDQQKEQRGYNLAPQPHAAGNLTTKKTTEVAE